MEGKVKIGKNAKVNIKWKTLPTNYNKEKSEDIKFRFAKKYGIDKENVNIDPVFITINNEGSEIPYASGILENIQNPTFQQEMFAKYIEENNIEGYDFNKIVEIDNMINNSIDYEIYDKHKKYTINWIRWKNFMSYGPDNYVDLRSLKGLVLLSSEPANQGGKSTFCLDLFRFLLFGKVTSREDDWTLAKAFNHHLPEATEMFVEGCVTIDGTEYIIKRTLTRPSLEKRTPKSRVTQVITYSKIANGQAIELTDENDVELQNGVSNTETNKAIKEAIGNERDFDLMISVNSDNLKGLISLKDTERGRLISRWIGLLPLEEKDKNAREIFNKSINSNLLSNRYNKVDIEANIENYKEENDSFAKKIEALKADIEKYDKKISDLNEEKDTLLQSKKEIDNTLLKADVATITAENERIKNDGIIKKAEKERNEAKYKEIGEVSFDKEMFEKLSKEREDTLVKVNTGLTSCKQVKVEISALKKGEYCPTCGAKLKDVDNTEKIAKKEKDYSNLVAEGKKNREKLENLTKTVDEMKENREKYNEKTKLGLIIEKNEVDIENLRGKMRENLRLLKDIEKNKQAIENNNRIETTLNIVKENIKNEEKIRTNAQSEIIALSNAIERNNKTIEEGKKNIAIIKKEEILLNHWRLYLTMVGKNGISKMVLRTVLPLINGELQYLLDDVCDFDVEISIDDHNDVAFYLIHDNVRSNLASGSGFEQTVASLALRSVLAKISTFSKPSFIIFDEILGGVSDENYDNIKKLYEKILTDYSFIMQISHLKQITDWHSSFLTVKKVNNISTISQN